MSKSPQVRLLRGKPNPSLTYLPTSQSSAFPGVAQSRPCSIRSHPKEIWWAEYQDGVSKSWVAWTGLVEVQLLELLEELASSNFSATIGPAVVGHNPGVTYDNQSAHGAEPCAGKVTPIINSAGPGPIKHCEPVADDTGGNRLCSHAFVPCGTATRYPLWRSTQRMTQSYTSS